MGVPRQHLRLPPLLTFLLLIQSMVVVATFENNFDAYPTGAQTCLYSASTASECNGNNVTTMNACLCSNGGDFVTASAQCIGKLDSADLETVYSTMESACSNSNTPLSVSQKDFLLAAASSSSSSSSPSSTTSGASSQSSQASMTTITTSLNGHATTITTTSGGATSTGSSSNDDGDNSGSISSTGKVGIIAGAAVASVAILAALIFFIIRLRRKKQSGEENRPMLGGPGGTELPHYPGGSTYDWKAAPAGDHGSEAKWPHDPNEPYPSSSPSPAYFQAQHSGGGAGSIYELPVGEVPPVVAEMPSTPLVASANTAYRSPSHQLQQWDPNVYR